MICTRATMYFLKIAGISRRPTASSWFTTAKSRTRKVRRDLVIVALWLFSSTAHPTIRFPFCMQITPDGPGYFLDTTEGANGFSCCFVLPMPSLSLLLRTLFLGEGGWRSL